MRQFPLFLLLLLVVAIVLRVDFFFTILYFFAGILILARLWTQRAGDRLRVGRTFEDHAFPGDQVPVDLTVENTGWLPVPWLELRESIPVDLIAAPIRSRVTSLGPHEVWHDRYLFNCRRRGYYTVGPLRVGTGDLFGLVGQTREASDARRFTVYPRLVSLEQLGLPTRSPLVALPARTPLFEDASRVRGVRDYQRGDALRRMHWSATARLGRPVVKQYEPAIARETLICLDLDAADYSLGRRYEATEMAVVVAASLAGHIIGKEGLPAGLLAEALDPLVGATRQIVVAPRAERAHLVANVLDVLARVQVTADTGFVDLLRRESPHLAWGATLVVITGQAGAALLETLLYLRHRGFAVALILVHPGAQAADGPARAEGAQFPVYHVWEDRDLGGLHP